MSLSRSDIAAASQDGRAPVGLVFKPGRICFSRQRAKAVDADGHRCPFLSHASHFIGNKQNIIRKSRDEFARDRNDPLQRLTPGEKLSKTKQTGRLLDAIDGLEGRLSAIDSPKDLALPLVAAAKMLGFDYVALAEHGDLVDPRRSLALISNYPASWQRHFTSRRLDRIDPVQRACQKRASGFRWSELSRFMDLRPQQADVLLEARRHGLGDGFTVPLHLPGMRAASCSFSVAPGGSLPHDALWAADVVARLAFDRLRAMARPASTSIRLSPRQRACVALMAAGLTDRGIARRLALSEETVTKYLNAARRRYGLARRTQLVAAALRDGIIGYEDLVLD